MVGIRENPCGIRTVSLLELGETPRLQYISPNHGKRHGHEQADSKFAQVVQQVSQVCRRASGNGAVIFLASEIAQMWASPNVV
jgi:hypothetical protein